MRDRIHLQWRDGSGWSRFRAGVSLHSHTSHSRETLDFIPRFAAAAGLLRRAVRAQERRYAEIHGREVDYLAAWWTPPLGPREALEVERAQIEGLGMRAIVSLSDHDNIEAPLLLRVLSESRDIPISAEWTVPFRGQSLHLGVHNMPPRRAAARMAEMARFTASPRAEELGGILDWLGEDPATLVVFNHPFWDEKGGGEERQREVALEFLRRYGRMIHAVELNGLRPWSENRKVLELSEEWGIPAVSGGDRHCTEPNALLNLTNARTFGEFAGEVREDGLSRVLVMQQYREPLAARILGAIADVMRDNGRHTHGWVRWSDRVFFTRADGSVEPLSAVWAAGREPFVVRQFAALARLVDHGSVKAAMRHLLSPAQEWSL